MISLGDPGRLGACAFTEARVASLSALCPDVRALLLNFTSGPGVPSGKGPDFGTDRFEVILQTKGREETAGPSSRPLNGQHCLQDLLCLPRLLLLRLVG